MGLFKKVKNLAGEEDKEMAQIVKRVNRIEDKGLFKKRLSLDYKPIMHNPTIFFRCLDNDSYSFRINKNNLRDFEESSFWQKVAKKEEMLFFRGFASRFYEVGFGSLNGYLSTINQYRTLGIYLKEGVVKDLLTEKDLIPYQAWLAESTDIDSNKGKGKTKDAKKH